MRRSLRHLHPPRIPMPGPAAQKIASPMNNQNLRHLRPRPIRTHGRIGCRHRNPHRNQSPRLRQSRLRRNRRIGLRRPRKSLDQSGQLLSRKRNQRRFSRNLLARGEAAAHSANSSAGRETSPGSSATSSARGEVAAPSARSSAGKPSLGKATPSNPSQTNHASATKAKGRKAKEGEAQGREGQAVEDSVSSRRSTNSDAPAFAAKSPTRRRLLVFEGWAPPDQLLNCAGTVPTACKSANATTIPAVQTQSNATRSAKR